MSTASKLSYLAETKAAIKEAIIAQGVAVGEGDTFRSYGEKIGEISTSGGTQYVTMSVDLETQASSTYMAYLAQTEEGIESIVSILGTDTSIIVTEKQVPVGSVVIRGYLVSSSFWKTLEFIIVSNQNFNVADDDLEWIAVS